MAIGFQVFNDSNIIQIDQDYRNMSFIRSFYVSTNAAWWGGYRSGTFTVASVEFPCLAFRSSYRTWVFLESRSGNSWTFRFVARVGGDITMSVYQFGEVPPSGSNYGLQVFRSDGSLAFDSNQNYFKVRGQLSGIIGQANGGPIPGDGSTYSWETGVPVAVMPSFIGGGMLIINVPAPNPGGGGVIFYTSILLCEFNTPTASRIDFNVHQTSLGTSQNPADTKGIQPYYDFLAVDLSTIGII